jgi:catechol 2,3-dioxygenase-like lactoylglutathione lyase family enzyme
VEIKIWNLLEKYERGKLSRRELIQGISLLAAAGSAASAAGFKAGNINHVSIQVSDLQRSADWYKRAFGLSELKTSLKDTVILAVGPAHITLRAGKAPGTVDHYAIGFDPFNQAEIVDDLKKRGFNPSGGQIKDPDGLVVQLSSLDGHPS